MNTYYFFSVLSAPSVVDFQFRSPPFQPLSFWCDCPERKTSRPAQLPSPAL